MAAVNGMWRQHLSHSTMLRRSLAQRRLNKALRDFFCSVLASASSCYDFVEEVRLAFSLSEIFDRECDTRGFIICSSFFSFFFVD
jgi:hypothetical protein